MPKQGGQIEAYRDLKNRMADIVNCYRIAKKFGFSDAVLEDWADAFDNLNKEIKALSK